MAIQAHLVELERKHKVLENELHEALVHLSTDDLQIVELKRRKVDGKGRDRAVETYRLRNDTLVTPQTACWLAGMNERTLIPRGPFSYFR